MTKQMFPKTRKQLVAIFCDLITKLTDAKDAFMAEAKQIYQEAREDYEKKKKKKRATQKAD